MYDTKFIGLYTYQILDAIKDGKKVMCLDRTKLNAICLNAMSVEDLFKVLDEAEKAEKEAGTDYHAVSRYAFWYPEIEEVQENVDDAVSDDGSS